MSELSVIMGVYNCPSKEMLTRAIDSILNQTFLDFKFIICDDGSTNDTLKWLKEKEKEDSRITVIGSEKNQGLAAALNMCLEKAKSTFIARQDIDDYSAQTRFQTQIDFLKKHKNIAFVGTDCFVYDKNSIYGEWHRPEYPTKQDFLFNSPFIHGTTMFRREVFEKCGGYRLIGRCRKYEDYDFFMRAYAAGFQGANINQLLYTFYSEEKKNFVPKNMRLDEYEVRKNGFKLLKLITPKSIAYTLKPIGLIFVPNKLLNSFKDCKKNSLLHKRSLSIRFYKLIVNRNSYIKFNYERYVNTNRGQHKRFPFISWLYLIKLNFESLFFKKKIQEESPRKLTKKESVYGSEPSEIAAKLCESEVVSFDVFDTLLFRPFAVPSDLFYFVGEKLNYPDFRTIRIEAERTLRFSHEGERVTLKDIYDFISERTGINSELGQKTEMEIEYNLCVANPYMKKVWDYVKKSGKKVILTSDMYLLSEFIAKLLENCGYNSYDGLFISCERQCGKNDGKLYELIKNEINTESISHIGDNYLSDVRNAQRNGINAIEYKNVNSYGNIFRPKSMSPIIGSAYSGIVNRRLYSGDLSFSPAYEYGYKYGGLLILGFCEYIHKISKEKQADKILFFSRDGYIVKKIYEMIYPEDKTEYVYWSRNAAAKLGADLFRDNFIKRFITQKINHNISIYDIMDSIGISDWKFPFEINENLSSQTAEAVEKFIKSNWSKLISHYDGMNKAAKLYFEKVLKDCKNVITVDCGWAGSGNIFLEQIANKNWNLDCKFTGVLAGANSHNQYDSDYSETFMLDGKLQVYCFSSSLNRDKYMAHMPSSNHNIYFELLFSAPEPSFREFRLKNGNDYEFVFDNEVENELYIREIQKGETDFIVEYLKTFEKYPFMRNISGSDAYAPFMDAMKHSKKYIDKVFSECVFDETTNGKKVRIR